MLWFKEYFSPIVSLVFSSFAFLFTLKNEISKKFNLKFSILNDKTFEMETDRNSKDNPDVYYHDKYRFLPTVVLTNESSNPVTVIDVKLNHSATFNFHTKVGERYETTFQTNVTTSEHGFDMISADKIEKIVIDNADELSLSLPLTIGPYQSVTGLLMFHYQSSIVGNNTITINTSRGSKEYEITVASQYICCKNFESDPLLPN